jgi:hypothetical protein
MGSQTPSLTSQEFRILFATISAIWAVIRITGAFRNYFLFIRMMLPEGKGTVAHRLISRSALRIFITAIMDPALGVLAGIYVGFWILGWD